METQAGTQYRPIYGAHRYFARRPHNVVASLIDEYVPHRGMVVDPFAGGGVVALESALIGRQSFSADYNPLATFIATQQITHWNLHEVQGAVAAALDDLADISQDLYGVACPACKKNAEIAWVEYSIATTCDRCYANRLAIDLTKIGPARYQCTSCSSTIIASRSKNDQNRATCIRLVCGHCGLDGVMDSSDILSFDAIRVATLTPTEVDLAYIPSVSVPDNNMQRESALHSKGFLLFADFFSTRSLIANARTLHWIDNVDDPGLRSALLFIFSSSLRYTNVMVTRNEQWRKSEPLEWNKAGYWIPNTHLDTNVFRHFARRAKSILRSKANIQSLKNLPAFSGTHELESAETNVRCISGARMEIDSKSVDAVITDPPYGSYVHYADLSNLWISWLGRRIGCNDRLAPTDEEAVAARKSFPGAKSYDQYSDILASVFAECRRILRPGGNLVLTFNNREPRAWRALVQALENAGFSTADVECRFQSGIERYEHTSQLRRAGSMHGDFVLRFKATVANAKVSRNSPLIDKAALLAEIKSLLENEGPLSNRELFTKIYERLLASQSLTHASLASSDINDLFESSKNKLQREFAFDGSTWSIRNTQ